MNPPGLDYKIYLSILPVIIATIVAIFAIRHNISINRRNKRIDIIAGCNARYDTIYDLRLKLVHESVTEAEVAAYFGRFWGLKSDQFDYWLAGFVDIETFTDWCFMTVKSFSENKSLRAFNRSRVYGEYTFDAGWHYVGLPDHQVTNQWFTELTFALRELGIWWKNQQPSHASTVEKEKELQSRVRESLFQIISIIIIKSVTYRNHLRHEMRQVAYKDSAEEFDILGLTFNNRSETIADLKKRCIYWNLRRLPIFGSILAKLNPSKSENLKPFKSNIDALRASKNTIEPSWGYVHMGEGEKGLNI
jgi:hypothetical protein